MVILGEVRTSLLHNSLPLPAKAVVDLLSLRPGRQVAATERPINRTLSADSLVGVDCVVASEPRTRARGIGTVASRAVVVGGLVAQASSRARLEWTAHTERKPWAHYARHRGTVEVLGKLSPEQAVAGFLMPVARPESLDLGAICQRTLTLVQGRPQLDHVTKLRTRPTTLRWTAVTDDDAPPSVHLRIEDETNRTVRLVLPSALVDEAARFCEDLAVHDWLYTTLGRIVEQAERDIARGADPMEVLGAALSLLVRMWMPGAHVPPALRELWQQLETTPGFTWSWGQQVAWVRDQVAMRTLTAWQDARA
ncbi:SCO2521 family protein [Actinokineospora guangxiensis]|uniref:SCO2521 family protein n=1 Tax=Actinokineospora guangxiensis TaxID=1490288 RepID=A0ABW0EU65_9PSEU